MSSNRVVSEPSGNGGSGEKEREEETPHATPETLDTIDIAAAAVAVAVAAAAATSVSATAPANEPPAVETEEPTVETIEDVTEYKRENTHENIQPARPQASAQGNGEGSSSRHTHYHRNCIVSRTVNRRPPYLPEAPNAMLGQFWIDHIDSMLGVRTERQIEDMQDCVDLTARVLVLANNMLRQQREVLADLRRINSEECHDDSSSELTDPDELLSFTDLLMMSDEDENDGEGDGDDSSADGRGTGGY
ncbi:hypothetical protein VN97_g4453 [Penicillium thymicola]|uniref:Uncharacterized protein n=1 Tax=Penicillium thymicola TaxID=293382 RepID=A0AAI9TKJ2_PENTH|nr:hypothetical protein VN97_g4453 [Penicillium thymicola]